MSAPWALARGARSLPDGSAHVSVWAPRARTVVLRARGREHVLESVAGGVHEGVVTSAPPGTDYTYALDGGPERPDPVSRLQAHGVHGPSRIVSPDAFVWSDADWSGHAMADLVLYELHVGTFTPEGTFDAVIPRLEPLRDLGITAVELMPVAAFPGDRNWGYDGVYLYAPHAGYGGPDGLRRLVNAAHRMGLGVVLDVVYNHLGPEGNYLADFGPYFTDRYRTPWGPAVNFDGPESDEVRRYLVDNARYWVAEYHVDGLRLDAVHAIYDFGARHILEELTTAVHAQAEQLGRTVVVIAESDLNDARLVRSPAVGGYGLDGQWNPDFHHAVHACLTGERIGYYADFGRTADVAKSLADRFVLDGRPSAFRRRRHGASATDIPAHRMVAAIQNHDEVGNRAGGERLDALLDAERRRLAAALLLCGPYVPLLFMGEEYGETNPFQYFVSHGDPDLIEAVRAGRRREFAAFAWPGDGADPQAETTFERSRLCWERREQPRHRQMLCLYRDLLALRRSEPVLCPGGARVAVACDEDDDVIEIRYRAGERVLCAWFNCSTAAVTVDLNEKELDGLTLALATDGTAYGGAGDTRLDGRPGGSRLELAPWTAAVLRGAGGN